MNDDQFDALMRSEFGGGDAPSERVWSLIQDRRRPWWLPAPREMLVAWAASAAVLVGVLWISSRPPAAPVEIASSDASAYTVAAVTQIAEAQSLPSFEGGGG